MSVELMRLSEEQWFYELLMGDKPPELDRLRRFKASSALDLGCGDGFTLVNLYYTLGVTHLEGVEVQSRSMLLDEINRRIRKKNSGHVDNSSLGQVFLERMTPSSTDLKPLLETSDEYDKLLSRVQFGVDVLSYVPQRIGAFDIVISSHLLHYLSTPALDRASHLIMERSHSQGLVYYSVKPDFEIDLVDRLRGDDLLAHCRELADQLKDKGLAMNEYLGPMSENNGQCYIFTNL